MRICEVKCSDLAERLLVTTRRDIYGYKDIIHVYQWINLENANLRKDWYMYIHRGIG